MALVFSLITPKNFPVVELKVPCFVLLGNYSKTLDKSRLFRLSIPSHFMKFSVFFPVSGNFRCERGSNLTASSAAQSTVSTFSAENPKIPRTFSRFLRALGTRDAWIRRSTVDSILSVENRAGAPSHRAGLVGD
jgi:hypothetical protein